MDKKLHHVSSHMAEATDVSIVIHCQPAYQMLYCHHDGTLTDRVCYQRNEATMRTNLNVPWRVNKSIW